MQNSIEAPVEALTEAPIATDPSAESCSPIGVLNNDRGAATAEYAIVIMAAVALAGVLVAIMRSGEVQAMLLDLVQRAFAAAG